MASGDSPCQLISKKDSSFQYFYMQAQDRRDEASPVFDNLDVDLFVKVLANTAFSELNCAQLSNLINLLP